MTRSMNPGKNLKGGGGGGASPLCKLSFNAAWITEN